LGQFTGNKNALTGLTRKGVVVVGVIIRLESSDATGGVNGMTATGIFKASIGCFQGGIAEDTLGHSDGIWRGDFI
jgi:hypothetical protein